MGSNRFCLFALLTLLAAIAGYGAWHTRAQYSVLTRYGFEGPSECLAHAGAVLDAERRTREQTNNFRRVELQSELARVVPALTVVLGATSQAAEAFDACRLLERIGYLCRDADPDVIRPAEDSLLAYLESEVEYPQRATAARALAHIRPLSQHTIESLVSVTKTMPDSRGGAFVALASAADYNRLARATIVSELTDTSDPLGQLLAAEGIVEARQQDVSEIRQILAKNLVSDSSYARSGALAFFSAFAESNPDIAELAKANLIVNIKGPQGDKLKSEAIRAASYAYAALDGDEDIVDALVTCALDGNESQPNRLMALGGLTSFATKTSRVRDAIKTLTQDSDFSVRSYAMEASQYLD